MQVQLTHSRIGAAAHASRPDVVPLHSIVEYPENRADRFIRGPVLRWVHEKRRL